MALHKNPEINAFLLEHMQSDGIIRIPQEDLPRLAELAANDLTRGEDAPYLVENLKQEEKQNLGNSLVSDSSS